MSYNYAEIEVKKKPIEKNTKWDDHGREIFVRLVLD